ncbi:hypothetical protein IWW57_001612 [Coemansia sp. S610]|uniref:Uncharacterized protein n=2 Tax=Coemansia TaxID=4863 RepID=A0A9W8GLW2_9FUNG|nr:hypothetical protein IWW57_001612 [Coemansia sp. S610]KAJ2387253.1 hypothetical protein H4S02_003452 [Coemansia sp. RSA 2611]KAJ2687214.1 hypothetical protein IWW39_003075 [Coemansia spiralis]KAJ2788496.1 hypothetical protein GGI18_002917 [Coemansia linderi]
MRYISAITLLALAACASAAPAANYGGNTAVVIAPPVVYPGAAYPHGGGWNPGNGNGNGNGSTGNGNGSGNGSNGNGNGSNGSGNNGSNGNGNNGSNGNGSNGNGSNGNGSNGNGGNGPASGPVGTAANCGLKPGQVSALTPLVEELKLTRTVADLKHLTKQITDLLGDTLQESAVSSLLNVVDSLVAGLGLGGLNLKPAVDSVTSILYKQVPCLLDTLLPSP